MSKRKRYLSSEWSSLLEQWSRSGESAERFAARLGVSVETLRRWQKAKDVTSGSSMESVAKPADVARSLFTPVQVVPPARGQSGVIEVVTRDGCVVRVYGTVDEATLASVLAVVGGC